MGFDSHVIDDPEPQSEDGFIQQIITEAVTSPLNIVLLAICCILIYKIYRASRAEPPVSEIPHQSGPPKLKRQDMTLEQLRQYDGKGEHGRVCVAVNGKVFDMTRGSRFYGPGGPYAAFAGHDATHALATFNMDDITNESADLSDLTQAQMDSVREWEMQFREKYDYIGRLLKEGDQPTEYSDEEDSKDTVTTPSSADASSSDLSHRQRPSSVTLPDTASLDGCKKDK